MVEKRGESRYAPTNERPGGRISYRTSGLVASLSDAREDAYKQMWERCGGKYRITQEWDQQGDSMTVANAHSYGRQSSGFGSTFTESFRVIDFECEGSISAREAAQRPSAYPDIQHKVGMLVNCPDEDVVIERAVWVDSSRVGYHSTACGDRFFCVKSWNAMNCSEVRPEAQPTALVEPE